MSGEPKGGSVEFSDRGQSDLTLRNDFNPTGVRVCELTLTPLGYCQAFLAEQKGAPSPVLTENPRGANKQENDQR